MCYSNFDLYCFPVTINWTSSTVNYNANLVVPIVAKMDAPRIIFIGDSLMTGNSTNQSYCNTPFIDNGNLTSLNTSIPYKIRTALDWTAQNMAIGGEELGFEIINRFQQDVINMEPQVVFINGGTNDILASQSKTDFINNYTSILNDTRNASIFTVVMSIPPADCGVIGNTTKCDYITEWNTDLKTLVDSYENAVYVETYDYVGTLNDTGTGINITYDYTDEGLHFNPTGRSKLVFSGQCSIQLYSHI